MKNSGIPYSSLPPHVRKLVDNAQNPTTPGNGTPPGPAKGKRQGFAAGGSGLTPSNAVSPFTTAGPARLRQSSKGPNKTEAAFAAHVRALYPSSTIFEQAVTLVLANGLRYTPDLFFPRSGATRSAFYEVKGFMRDDAAAKLKMAARVHRWADFYLVTRRGRTCLGWDIQVILP